MTPRAAYRHAWLWGFLLALQGCQLFNQTPGWQDVQVDTARKGIIQADAEMRGLYLLLEDLIDKRRISASDARDAKTYLDRARGYIRAVWGQIRTQDPDVALNDTLMGKVAVALSTASAILGTHSSTIPAEVVTQ